MIRLKFVSVTKGSIQYEKGKECEALPSGHTAADVRQAVDGSDGGVVQAGDRRRGRAPGRAVQVDPIKPTLKPPGTNRFKLESDKLLSIFAFNFKLRRYNLAPLGGPVVMVQVENELAWDAPREYVEWAGRMAEQAVEEAVAAAKGGGGGGGGGGGVSEGGGGGDGSGDDGDGGGSSGSVALPVLMCEGATASNAVPACNGRTCSRYLETAGTGGDGGTGITGTGRVLIDQPGVWTENEGGFQTWGGSPSNPINYFWGRAADEVARATLQWFARGGAHMNYYMAGLLNPKP